VEHDRWAIPYLSTSDHQQPVTLGCDEEMRVLGGPDGMLELDIQKVGDWDG
jgi:hypothetical protein